MDFVADLAGGLARKLSAAGLTYDEQLRRDDPVGFMAQYIEYQRRRISQRPRRVELSQELQSSPLLQKFAAAVCNLTELSRKGADLSPYQSKRIKFFNKRDMMLYDWKIQHLHLGEHKPGEKFAERTSELLFATFLTNAVYLIAIMDHDSFSEIELLEIVEANWPEYLDQFTLKGLTAVSPVPTSADVAMQREEGVQTVVTLKSGKILGPPGGGYSYARTSVSCMREAQLIARLLWNAEELVKAREEEIRVRLEISSEVQIRLAEYDPKYVAIIGEGGSKLLKLPVGQ
ncbi:MAG: hypothetical protein ACR2N0_02505 [Rubrobacteraceae bacterium]